MVAFTMVINILSIPRYPIAMRLKLFSEGILLYMPPFKSCFASAIAVSKSAQLPELFCFGPQSDEAVCLASRRATPRKGGAQRV